jgi:hypothetical protein
MRRNITVLLVTLLIVGVSTVVVADSPYSPTRHSEKIPFAPDRPATLNRTTATAYAIDYEQTLLYNDLLGSRGFTIDDGDDVRADCTVNSVNQTATGEFRIQLRCRGEIEDVFRLIQTTSHSYKVTYQVTKNELKELSVHGYPFLPRHELRQRPPSAE